MEEPTHALMEHHHDPEDPEEEAEVQLPPEVWCLIGAYLGSGRTLRHLARLALVSRRMHAMVWAQQQTLDISGLSFSAAWWRNQLRHRRYQLRRPVLSPDAEEGVEFESVQEPRDPLEHILMYLSRYSPELRRLSLPSDFSTHHVRLLPQGLRHLALHHVTNTLTISAVTAHLPYLSSLSLSGMYVTDDLLAELPPSLNTLRIEAALTTNGVFRGTFKSLPASLTSFHLRSCHSLTVPQFENLPPTLQVLDLSGSRGITGQKLTKLPRGLKVLNLRDCPSLMLAELAPALSRLTVLEELDLRGCTMDDSVVSLLPPSLRVLRLSGLLTDYALPVLPRYLQSLTLSNMPHITDKGLTAYLDHHFVWPKMSAGDVSNTTGAGSLRSLTLAFCPRISNEGLKLVPDLGLVKLKLKGGGRKCRITEDAFRRLPSTLRHLHIESAPFVHTSLLDLPASVHLVHR